MSDGLIWEPPGPGPWQTDNSHVPYMSSRAMSELLPRGYPRGFAEGLNKYGALLARLQPAFVNGFMYVQPQPFDMPGPDGPPDPAWVGEEFGRRIGLAAHAFEAKIWRQDLELWDTQLKPASIARHRELHAVDLAALDDEGLCAQIHDRAEHVVEMCYQHHRFNISALAPVGDFALQASALAGVPPVSLFAALDGSSPVSGMVTPELAPVVAAVKADSEALALVRGDGDPAARLEALRARVPAVAEWLAITEYRLVDGLDVIRPTMVERPELCLGKLEAALDAPDHEVASARAQAFAAEVRARIPADQQPLFDDLLAEARHVNRLRDERGLYSDTPAMGLLRLAMLEAGRRLTARGVLRDPAEAVEAGIEELTGLLRGASTPTAEELAGRTELRRKLGPGAAPALLGPPPPPPPPADQLPPPLARLMSSVGFAIEGVLGELPEPAGDDRVIGGIGAGPGVYEGPARVVVDFDDLFDLEPGDVLVTPATMESFNAMLHLVGAIVTDHGSFASHAAIMARELGFPAVVGTVNATARLTTGVRVRVDAGAGQVTVIG